MLSQVVRGLGRVGIGAIALTVTASVFAGPGPEQGIPWVGEKPVLETTAQIMSRAKLDPVYEPGQAARQIRLEHDFDRSRVVPNPLSPLVSQWPPKGPSALKGGGPYLPQTVGTSFLATQISNTPGFIPPDTMGDVGPSHIVVMVNGSIRSFDKAGNLGAINTTTDNWFNSVRNGSGTSDPRVRYDRLTGRWFLCIINVAGSNNRVLLAVSSGSNPDTSTWAFYFFNLQSGGGGAADNGGFFDYPTLGVDNNALYIGGNVFIGASGFTGSTGFVVRKSTVLTGGSIVVTAFRQLCTATANGPYTPQGVDNPDTAATEGYFIGVGSLTFGDLWIRRVTNPGGTPAISGNIQLIVPATGSPQDFTIGGAGALDTLDDRLFAARIFKNRLTGVSTLWTAHNFEVNSSGVANAAGNRNGSRWYQIGNLTGTPTLVQSGTMFDSAATNMKHYWIPSVAMSGQGHMAIGTTYGSAVDDAGVAVAGRLSSDTLGTTQAPTLAVTSTFNYNVGSPVRWGDYSYTCVDPTDDMTMWTFQEYANATNSWGVRVIQLRAPAPVTPSSATPAVTQGQTNVNVTVTGTSTGGTGFFYAGAGFNPITASVSGTGVTVNSVTFNSPTSVTLNLNVSGSAPVGTRNVTITNPDGQSATGNGILTVNAGSSPPTITTISPNNATAAGPAFNLTVNGTNFTGTSVVRWNGSNRTTTFNSATQLTASILASDIATVGTATVTVFDSAGTSNGVTFTINPILLDPNSVTLVHGVPRGGNVLSSIVASDNVRYRARMNFETARLSPKVIIDTVTNTSSPSASRIDIALEAMTTGSPITQAIHVWNGTAWIQVDSATGTASDSTRTVSITTGAGAYLIAGQIKVRITYFTLDRENLGTAEGQIDRLQLTVYP